MANYLSQPAHYAPTISTTDIAQLTGQVQTALQQRFDVNTAKIDDLISRVSNIPLVRDKDKEYLGNRLQSILHAVDANTKFNDLSNPNVTRQIQNAISLAVDDTVKTQVANAQKISNFQTQAAQLKKDKPELYNDGNYTYALDKAGYSDYVSGKTDELGTLEYTPYYDLKENLDKPLEAWAKERGFEKVVDSSVEGGYIYKTVKGKALSEGEIENYINNKILSDPKLKQQMMINSYTNFRGLSDDQIFEQYKAKADAQIGKVDTKIGLIENEIKNTNPDDLARLETLRSNKTAHIDIKNQIQEQTKKENFNRTAVTFSDYKNTLMDSYKKAYGYAAVTDIEYNDMLLDAATSLAKDGKSKGTVGGAGSMSVGTAFDSVEEKVKEEEQKPLMTQFKDKKAKDFTYLNSQMDRELSKQGKALTKENRTQLYAGLKQASQKGYDINAQGYSSDLIDSFNTVVQNNKTTDRIVKEAKQVYGVAVDKTLDGLFGGKAKDLNVDGLALTMPHTAGLLKKYSNPNQMTAKERALAKIEIANNMRKQGLIDEEDADSINLYTQSVKRENSIKDTDLKAIQQSQQEDEGFWSNAWDAASGAFKTAYNAPSPIGGVVTGILGLGNTMTALNPFNWGSANAPARNAAFAQNKADYEKAKDQTVKALKNLSGMFHPLTTDTDLSEIESGDIDLGGKDVYELTTDSTKSMKARLERVLLENKENLPATKSIVLNPEMKSDVAAVEQIRSAISAFQTTDEDGNRIAYTPDEKTNIVIRKVENGQATIEFDALTRTDKDKGGQAKEVHRQTITIPVTNLPKNVVDSYSTTQSNWTFSAKNPTEFKSTLAYKPFADLDSRYDFTQKYIENNASKMSQAELKAATTTGFSEFKTRDEFIDKATQYLPPAYAKQFYEQDLNADYAIDWERPRGGGGFKAFIKKNGKRVAEVPPMSVDYTTHNFSLQTMKLINTYLDNRITELRKQALR